MAGYLIYQSIVEPLKPIPPVESITIDKWYKDHPNPVLRKALQVAILAGSFFYVEVQAQVPNDKLPEWLPQPNQPQRLITKLPRQHTGEFRFELPRTVYTDDWFKETQQPYFSKKRFYNTGESRFEVPRDILITDWFQPIQQPQKVVTKLPRLNTGDTRTELELITQETITLDKWYYLIGQPYFSKSRQQRYGESRFEVPRTILISDWFQPTHQPTRRPRTNIELEDFIKADIRIEVSSDTDIVEWYQPISQPYFSKYTKRPQLLGGEYRFEVPRTILLSDWFQEIKQPYFNKRRFYYSGENKLDLPRTILVSDWYKEIIQPILRKTQHQQGIYFRPDIVINDTQINEWYQPASEPYFSKKRNYFTGEFRFEIPRTVLITDWLSTYPDKIYSRFVRQIIDNKEPIKIDITENITLDKWLSINNYIRKQPFSPIYEYLFYKIETIIQEQISEIIPSHKGGGKRNKYIENTSIRDEEEILVIMLKLLLDGIS